MLCELYRRVFFWMGKKPDDHRFIECIVDVKFMINIPKDQKSFLIDVIQQGRVYHLRSSYLLLSYLMFFHIGYRQSDHIVSYMLPAHLFPVQPYVALTLQNGCILMDYRMVAWCCECYERRSSLSAEAPFKTMTQLGKRHTHRMFGVDHMPLFIQVTRLMSLYNRSCIYRGLEPLYFDSLFLLPVVAVCVTFCLVCDFLPLSLHHHDDTYYAAMRTLCTCSLFILSTRLM